MIGDIGCIGVPVRRYNSWPFSSSFKRSAHPALRLSAHVMQAVRALPSLSTAMTLCMAELKETNRISSADTPLCRITLEIVWKTALRICSGSCSAIEGEG
ncbi:hypothetical protein D3C78_1166620 [compost metagenome]